LSPSEPKEGKVEQVEMQGKGIKEERRGKKNVTLRREGEKTSPGGKKKIKKARMRNPLFRRYLDLRENQALKRVSILISLRGKDRQPDPGGGSKSTPEKKKSPRLRKEKESSAI